MDSGELLGVWLGLIILYFIAQFFQDEASWKKAKRRIKKGAKKTGKFLKNEWNEFRNDWREFKDEPTTES